MCAVILLVVCSNFPQMSYLWQCRTAVSIFSFAEQNTIGRAMAEGGASGPPDLISGMIQPVDLVNSVTRYMCVR